MAEHQRIYPDPVSDVEAPKTPTTVPLVPRGTVKSDENEQYPPFRRAIPVMHSKPPKKKRSCFCKCFCWTFTVLLLLIITIGIVAGILYLVFRPKLPDYSIDQMEVTQFSLSNNQSLEATFNVTITATNPNKKIGIYYEGGSHISVWYIETKLCEGAIPKFYQGHRNTTVLNLPLKGQTDNATEILGSLQAQQQRTGNIPLNLKVNQPVRVKLGSLKLFKVKFLVRCSLLIDAITPNKPISIQSRSCKFKLRLN